MSTVSPWPDDCQGAVSLTFDDGMTSQLQIAIGVADPDRVAQLPQQSVERDVGRLDRQPPGFQAGGSREIVEEPSDLGALLPEPDHDPLPRLVREPRLTGQL